MSEKNAENCAKCKGKGSINHSKKCDKCNGLGFSKMVIGSVGDKCKKCGGSGKIITSSKCSNCNGTGKIHQQPKCIICGKEIKSNEITCNTCEPIIHKIIQPANFDLIKKNHLYRAKVLRIKDFGYFVELASKIEGLVRERGNIKEGDHIVVKFLRRNDRKLEFIRINLPADIEFKEVQIHKDVPFQKIGDSRDEGSFISLQARVESIRLIPKGPKIFKLLDETGIIEAAAFRMETPDIKQGDIIEILGKFNYHQGKPQIEITNIFIVDPVYEKNFRKKMEAELDKKSQPEEIPFLVKSEVLELLKDKFIAIAKRLRRAIIENQPILIRHHADTDGITAGISVEHSLRNFYLHLFGDEDQLRHLVKRLPNKPPFIDPLDAIKDIDFALQDQEKFGDKLPLLLILDTGSSEESRFSYESYKAYGMEIMIVDHHFPEASIQDIVDIHQNVYYSGGDYNISAGMLGVELARFIHPNISDDISHLAAIAGIGDRAEGKELDQYLKIALEKGYSESELVNLAIAIDYLAYFLRFSPGRILVLDLLGIKGRNPYQTKMLPLLSNQAKDLLEKQLLISEKFKEIQELENGIKLVILDVDAYSPRFDFPPAGKITGSLFDKNKVEFPDTPIVTIGYGPDFMVFRSIGVNLEFPKLVSFCISELPYAGIDGGGHEIVGSMKFVEGTREEVMKLIVQQLSIKELL